MLKAIRNYALSKLIISSNSDHKLIKTKATVQNRSFVLPRDNHCPNRLNSHAIASHRSFAPFPTKNPRNFPNFVAQFVLNCAA